MRRNKYIVVLLCCLFISAFAQEKYSYKGNIQNDSISGLKRIVLTPKLRSVANTSLSDVRILLNDNNEQVPYFIQQQSDKIMDTDPLISIAHKIVIKAKHTEVVIDNPSKKIYNSFTFLVSNADVQKKCKIEGRNDSNQWYVISESIQLDFLKNHRSASNYFRINFPSIDYKHIRLIFNDSLSAPIHIKDIGSFKDENRRYESNFHSLIYKYSISKEESKTVIHVTANRAYEINKISFTIDSPKLFDRKATVFTMVSGEKQYLKNLNINSKTINTFLNLNINHQEFWVEIENNDNPAVSISNIQFFQKELYLVSDLNFNQSYSIVAGDKSLKTPTYDLGNFSNDFSEKIVLIRINNERITRLENEESLVKKFYEQAWFMWICIGVVALIILLFTISLLKKTQSE